MGLVVCKSTVKQLGLWTFLSKPIRLGTFLTLFVLRPELYIIANPELILEQRSFTWNQKIVVLL